MWWRWWCGIILYHPLLALLAASFCCTTSVRPPRNEHHQGKHLQKTVKANQLQWLALTLLEDEARVTVRMSGAEEREARSVALEKAYVHEVYDQISGTAAAAAAAADTQRGRAWPKVKQFLSELEPGSLVCDVGCGNGKYLSVNPSVFKVGADRCNSLAEIAREKDHEVLVCDNLSLPFRDESFDAVLSVAVVHHFATTERRVGALRELARVLRIGGRLIISVWAMEQRHRKFESQDVLVPWHRPQHLSTPSLELTSTTTTTSEEDGPPPYHAYTQTSDSDSCRSAVRPGVGQRKRGRSRHKGRSIDPARPCSSSQSSSSLSSPNETCYSFVRRALQKLAGGKRGGSGHRPWFLDSWSSCTKEPPPPHRYDPDGCEDGEGDGEDIQDLPIELRRLEEDNQQQQEQPPEPPQRRQTFACTRRTAPQEAILLNHKSKSLSDILTVGQRVMVRSRSSVPSLGLGTGPETCTSTSITTSTPPTGSSTVDVSVSTAVSVVSSGCTCTGGTTPGITSTTTTAPSSSSKPKLVKQKKSLCEEEMEEEGGDQPTDMRNLIKALPEFKVPGYGSARRAGNVFKQSSMNEELMSTERLREKERVRQNIQKQASLNEELIYRRHRTLDSLRDTFFSTSTAKRFQLLKNGLTNKLKSSTTGIEKVAGTSFKNGFVRILQGWKGGEVSPNPGNRPSPSDSSGTAVPPCTPPPDGKKSNNNSFSASEDNNKNNNNAGGGRVGGGERRHSREDGSDSSKDSSLQSDTSVDSEDSFASVIFVPKPDLQTPATDPSTSPAATNQISPPKSPQPTSPKVKQHTPPPTSPKVKQLSPPPLLPPPATRTPAFTEETPLEEEEEAEQEEEEEEEDENAQEAAAAAAAEEEEKSKQNERLKQIQELLRSRVGPVASGRVPSSVPRNAFPLVRRSSAMALGRPEPLAKPLPRLLSLELFNPETDDMDSDSSGVSSPDSISSVISVLTEEPIVTSTSITTTTTATITTTTTTSTMQHVAQGTPNEECVPILCSPSSLPAPPITTANASTSPKAPEIVTERLLLEVQEAVEEETGSSESLTTEPPPRISPSSISLLEAAADVASSLEDAVDAVIQSSPRARRRKLQLLETNDPMLALQGGSGSSSGSSTWSLHKSDSSSRGSDWSLHKPDGGNKFLTSVTAATSPVVSNNNYPWSVSGHSPVGSRKVSPRAERRCYDDYGILEEEEVIGVPEEEDTWDESCRQHLADFAEKLSEKLLEEIDQYRRQTCCAPQNQPSSSSSSFHNKILAGLPEGFEHIDDPYLSRLSEELQDLTKLSEELQERSSFLASLNNTESILLSDDGGFTNPGFYTATQERNSNNTMRDIAEQVRRHEEETVAIITVPDVISSESTDDFSGTSGDVMLVCSRQTSDDITEDLDTCVEVLSKGDEEQEEGEELFEQTAEETSAEQVQETVSAVSAAPEQGPLLRSIAGSVVSLRPGYSIESSDAGDVSEQTTGTSGSDCSRKDNNSAGGKTASSTTSLMESTSDAGSSERTTGSDCSRDLRYADRRTARCDGRSSSEEAPLPPPSFPTRGPSLVRQKEPPEEPLTKTESCASSLSGSTSQESLPSDNGGGAITFHRYYHVFREGELDQLIERYVENLHIISSYYDHANWCVVAEKVHVWTI